MSGLDPRAKYIYRNCRWSAQNKQSLRRSRKLYIQGWSSAGTLLYAKRCQKKIKQAYCTVSRIINGQFRIGAIYTKSISCCWWRKPGIAFIPQHVPCCYSHALRGKTDGIRRITKNLTKTIWFVCLDAGKYFDKPYHCRPFAYIILETVVHRPSRVACGTNLPVARSISNNSRDIKIRPLPLVHSVDISNSSPAWSKNRGLRGNRQD